MSSTHCFLRHDRNGCQGQFNVVQSWYFETKNQQYSLYMKNSYILQRASTTQVAVNKSIQSHCVITKPGHGAGCHSGTPY